jgi:hypothetical protein
MVENLTFDGSAAALLVDDSSSTGALYAYSEIWE